MTNFLKWLVELLVKNPKVVIVIYVFLLTTTGGGVLVSHNEASENEATQKQIAIIAEYYESKSRGKNPSCNQCLKSIKELQRWHQ